MAERPVRWIPIFSALRDFAVVAVPMLLWRPHTYTLWWFVPAVPVVLFLLMGCMSVWHAFFISDASLRRRLQGDYTD